MSAHNLLATDYQANVRNAAYLMERACVAAANADSPEAWSMRRMYAQDARNLVAMARERLARNRLTYADDTGLAGIEAYPA